VPVVPPSDPSRGPAPSRQPAEWGSESRGLAGSAAYRLAGPDPLEPAPATPVGSRRGTGPDADVATGDRHDAPAEVIDAADADAPDDWAAEPAGWAVEPAAPEGAWVAGSATARTSTGRVDDDEPAPPRRPPARRPTEPPGRAGRRRRDATEAPARSQVHRPSGQDAQELFGPAWERPRRYEAYPSLRTRIGMPRGVPRAAGYAALLGVVAVLLFLLGPRILGLVADDDTTGAASPTPVASAAATPSPEPTEPPPPTPQVYVVKDGDTMSKIARRFGVTVEDIMAANPQIKNPDRIRIGDRITIPPPADENGFPEDGGAVEGETPSP
jgi:hypothetical protein